MEEKNISLGFCRKAHGIKGEAVFSLYSGSDSILSSGDIIIACKDKQSKEIKIEKIRFGNKVIVKLEGINDRTTLEKLLPFEIFVSRDLFPEIDSSDEFYISDILGTDVFDFKTKQKIGVIDSFYDNGAQVVYVIKGNEQNFELPFVEQFFPIVKLDKNRIEIVLPEIINEKS
ncbi:MAG: 16S rRNA processing protein RimM [Bdellovibrionales bacterium]|nr:16S rRNA processing protein RimM [Bdellovibrionales bacterium]